MQPADRHGGPPAVQHGARLAPPHRQGQGEDRPAGLRRRPDGVEDARVDLLEQARDARHDGRPDLQQVLRHRVDRLGVGNRRPRGQVGELDHPLEHVRQRQERQGHIAVGEGNDLQGGADVAGEVAVGEHHPFRVAGRPGGIQDAGEVGRRDRHASRLEAARVGAVGLLALVEQRRPRHGPRRQPSGGRVEDHHALQLRKARQDRADFLHLRGGRDHQDARLAVVEDVADLLGQQGGVDRDGDRPEIQRGVVEGGPLRPVLRQDGDAVPLARPDRGQAERQRSDGGGELVCGDVAPGPSRLVAQQVRLAEARLELRQDVAEGPDLHAPDPPLTCRTSIRG